MKTWDAFVNDDLKTLLGIQERMSPKKDVPSPAEAGFDPSMQRFYMEDSGQDTMNDDDSDGDDSDDEEEDGDIAGVDVRGSADAMKFWQEDGSADEPDSGVATGGSTGGDHAALDIGTLPSTRPESPGHDDQPVSDITEEDGMLTDSRPPVQIDSHADTTDGTAFFADFDSVPASVIEGSATSVSVSGAFDMDTSYAGTKEHALLGTANVQVASDDPFGESSAGLPFNGASNGTTGASNSSSSSSGSGSDHSSSPSAVGEEEDPFGQIYFSPPAELDAEQDTTGTLAALGDAEASSSDSSCMDLQGTDI
jgi:hypothetical protein